MRMFEWDETKRKSNYDRHSLDMDYKIKSDLERLDSLTDEDIRRAIAEDPDAAPELTEEMMVQALSLIHI